MKISEVSTCGAGVSAVMKEWGFVLGRGRSPRVAQITGRKPHPGPVPSLSLPVLLFAW